MKATPEQYAEAVKLYQATGASSVYDYARTIGLNEYAECIPCAAATPVSHDNSCFICGTNRKET